MGDCVVGQARCYGVGPLKEAFTMMGSLRMRVVSAGVLYFPAAIRCL